MLVNIVTVVNEALTIISRGEVSVGIYREGNHVIVSSSLLINDVPYVPYNIVCHNESHALSEYYRLIGTVASAPLEHFLWCEVDASKHMREGNSSMSNCAFVEDISNLIHAEITRLLG